MAQFGENAHTEHVDWWNQSILASGEGALSLNKTGVLLLRAGEIDADGQSPLCMRSLEVKVHY